MKSATTLCINVRTAAQDGGLLRMIVQTPAQILSCSPASVSSTFSSRIQAKKTPRMFSDLSDPAYLYFSLCTSGRRPRTIRTWISGISKQHLSWGSAGSGLHTLQAIYSTYRFYFSIDCFYFETGRFFSYFSVYLSGLGWLIAEFTAVICSGYFIGRTRGTSVDARLCDSWEGNGEWIQLFNVFVCSDESCKH